MTRSEARNILVNGGWVLVDGTFSLCAEGADIEHVLADIEVLCDNDWKRVTE